MQEKHLLSRNRLYMWLAATVALILVILGAAYINHPQAQTSGLTQVVSPSGGTYQFDQLTVIVPPGAVSTDTQLTATRPKPQPGDQPAPLQGLDTSGVRFDLSLANNLQPVASASTCHWLIICSRPSRSRSRSH